MMHSTVFAKQDARSMWLKHFIIKLNESKFTNVSCYNVTRQKKTLSDVADEGNVSIILKNTYSTFHVDNCKHSVAAFDQIFR